MPLFDVPGWTVPTDPVVDSTNPKKRKRLSGESNNDSQMSNFKRLTQNEFNFDKIMSKLKGSDTDNGERNLEKSTQKTGKRKGMKGKADAKERPKISRPMPLQPRVKSDSTSALHPRKKKKTVHEPLNTVEEDEDVPMEEAPSHSEETLVPTIDEEPSTMTAMQKSMKQSLDGARFRIINEQLYKSDSKDAFKMIQDDPKVFAEYHTGFRHQVQSWPTNPVQYYIEVLSKYPAKTLVADLGCGDAALAQSLLPKGLNVLSFDLVSSPYVIQADICARIPLPGSEPAEGSKSDGEGHVVDVVVCALSLMGTNWPACIREAWRILKPAGELKIAEVASRFTDMEDFISLVSSIGFKLQSKDTHNTHFTLLEFKKVPRKTKTDKEWNKVISKGSLLKPCEYKRR